MKKTILATLVSLPFIITPPTEASPYLGYNSVPTPYGTFGCRMRAENKLFAMGATEVNKTASAQTVWARHGSFAIGVWCRGPEAIIMVSGDSSSEEIRQELKSAF